MVVREPFTRTEMKNVIRCDKCCAKIAGKDREQMEVVVFNQLKCDDARKGQVVSKKYHLCWKCAFNLRDEMDERRERVALGGVTDAEQEFLLRGLFSKRGKR